MTEDGAETDLDLGHYERFTDANTTRASNVTAGGIYNSVIRRERRGDYLGGTVQVVPHITDEIKQRIRLIAETSDVDVVITEIGGTVGDIESLPFLEAIRQFPVDVGRRHCMFIHLTLVPYIGHAGELKTKPTQHSVNELRRIGIQPDMLLCRSEGELRRRHPQEDRAVRLARRSTRSSRPRTSTTSTRSRSGSTEQGVDDFICEHLGIEAAPRRPRRVARDHRARRRRHAAGADRARRQVRPARGRLPVGHRGAAPLAASCTAAQIEIDWVDSETLDTDEEAARRGWPTPTASSSPAASAAAASRARSAPSQVAREQRDPVPRRSAWACRSRSASSRATSPAWRAPTRPSSTSRPSTRSSTCCPSRRRSPTSAGRCAWAPTRSSCTPDTRARELYGEAVVYERHRHRYEVSISPAQAPRGRRARRLGHVARRAPGRGRRARATTRSSSPRSSTPSSSRAPSARRRCSASSSAPRCERARERADAPEGGEVRASRGAA